VALSGFAKWDGQHWSAVQVQGFDMLWPPWKLYAADTAAGPRLYVNGTFAVAGTEIYRSPLQWDGAEWTSVGEMAVQADDMLLLQEDGYDALYIAASGVFGVGDEQKPGSSFCRWGCCQDFRRGDVNCDGAVDIFDIDPFVIALVRPESYPKLNTCRKFSPFLGRRVRLARSCGPV